MLKMHGLKIMDQLARCEYAGHENPQREIAGPENDRPDSTAE